MLGQWPDPARLCGEIPAMRETRETGWSGDHDASYSTELPTGSCPQARQFTRTGVLPVSTGQRRNRMTWSTPIVEEVCLGMEVTSYESAEILF